MASRPEPDILECEVKWALRSAAVNKASGCYQIPAELFKSLKADALKSLRNSKVLHSLCQQIWKTQQWPQDWKKSILITIPKKGSTKECSNHQTIALTSNASSVMLKILQARLQQHMKKGLPDVQTGFRKGRGIRDQIANICWLTEKARCKLELCMEQPIGSGLRKEYDKPVYYHPVYLTYTQSTSCKMLG